MKIRSKGMILGMPLLAVLLMTGLWAMSHSAVQAAPQATYTVTNTNDSGAGSLRQAVLDANANAGVDTVNFAPALSGQTIVLTSGVIAISEGVSINGSGLTVPVTISGNNNSQIFTITAVGVSLNNLRIIEGRNVGGNGGAIFLSGAANVVINNSVIADNFATYDGGAIFLSEASTMVINNSVIADNVADLYRGGAIRTEGTLNVMGTTFINNESGGDGGAIENDSGYVTITNSTFTRNSGFQIGAVMNQNGSTMVIVNSTFVDNVNNNGAIGNRPSGTLTIANTIGGGASPICFNAGTLITSSNWFDDGSCSSVPNSGNPYLAPLDDNGGSTPTHALMVFSGAVGAGDSTYCPATDQRGISRATNCDLGAFEVQTADYLNVCRPGFTGGDTLIFASTGITTTVDTVGSLSQLCVTITETNHPSATPGIQTGLLYWSVNETAASNDWSLTMSAPVTFTLDVNDKLCRYTGTGTVWDCAMTSIDNTNNRITRSGITQLSDWAVGNDVGPSAVTMQSVTTDSASTLWLPVAVATLLLLLTGTAVYRLRRREG